MPLATVGITPLLQLAWALRHKVSRRAPNGSLHNFDGDAALFGA
jgi:hypothetical protein